MKCFCNENFGESDCSIDLTNISELNLDRECCDLRNEKCSEITGHGFPFSTLDKIYARIELLEVTSFATILQFISIKAKTENNHQDWLKQSIKNYS